MDHNISVKNGQRMDVAGPVTFIRLHASTAPLKFEVNGRTTTLAVGQAMKFSRPVPVFSVINESGADAIAVLVLGNDFEMLDSNISGTVIIETGSLVTTLPQFAGFTVALQNYVVIAAATGRRSIRFRNAGQVVGSTIALGGAGMTPGGANATIYLDGGQTHYEEVGANAEWYATSTHTTEKLNIQTVS